MNLGGSFVLRSSGRWTAVTAFLEAWDVFTDCAEPPQPNGVPDEFWHFPLPLPN